MLSALSLIVAIFATFYIPKKIMNNQIYADLIAEYRQPEFGQAIISVIRFYTDCCGSDIDKIEEKYIEHYKKEIAPLDEKKRINRCMQEKESGDINQQDTKYGKKELKDTLHFQRRLLAQYYAQLAALRYQGGWFTRLSKKKVREDFTAREAKLLSLLSYMNKAAEKIFIEYDIEGMPYADDKQNALLQKLYDEAQDW